MSSPGRLAEASVLVLGAGGLGSPAALALAASGVGRIGLVDDDVVDLSNLARQILHRSEDVGRAKVVSGAERLSRLAPGVRVETFPVRMTAGNAAELLSGFDVVVDGSDTISAKLMLNDACVQDGRPLVAGGILRFFGQILTVLPGETACYRCVFGRIAPGGEGPSCGEAGVFGAVAGVIGMAQAAEAVRLLLGLRPAWAGKLLTVDLWDGKFGGIRVQKDSSCPACSEAALDSCGDEEIRSAKNTEAFGKEAVINGLN